EVVRGVVIRMPNDPGTPAAQRHESPTLAVRSFDASPRLGQRGLGIPQSVVDLHDVRAVICGEYLGPDEVVTDESARDRVPVRGAATIHVDVRLNREPLAGVEAVGEVRADGHHGHRGRGWSAFFRTRPVGSMIRALVSIVGGLAVRRSPAFMTTQRYRGSGAGRFIAGPMSAPVGATLMCPCEATRSASPSESGVAC